MPITVIRRVIRAQVLCLIAAASLTGVAASAQEESFPSKPVRIVLLMAAGNGLDATTRTFADMLAKELGQPVLVDNRPGASGIIAFQTVKSAPADGYTLLIGSSSPTTVYTALKKPLPYDPFKDFKPVAGLLRATALFSVPADSKLTSMRDLPAFAKAKSGPVTVGTYTDLYNFGLQRLAHATGVPLENVPYKGYSAILVDLVGNRVDIAFGDATAPQELIRAGKIRALALTGKTRLATLPDVPTVAESGFPDYTFGSWDVFFVRSETPAPITEKLGAAIRRVLSGPDFPAYLRANGGSEVMLESVPEIQRMMENELAAFKAIAHTLPGAQPQ